MSDRFLDLLRHGEVQGGARFRGGHDDPLTAHGWDQMSRATANAADWTGILCSPSQRCADFARRLAETHGLPLRMDTAFGERDFGAWEGLAAHQIPADQLTRFWDDPVSYTPPGAETFPAFRERVLNVWNALSSSDDSHVLLITHGGVIRVLVAEVLRMPDEACLLFEVPPASLTRLRIPPPPGRPSLVFHRDVR
ncbi:histidine phosphatase family protein [uncultured Thiocystis sp.]|jgi:broad specificity phosphatase PhoE|uniref:histidine phosphatase family protein n=1 Tax=uncultured Thiocystis sp. TaxID=1202134 RepID=UPI0025F33300|nr:histidine phosphatase family protein [uncultured Thiocystis sp.]